MNRRLDAVHPVIESLAASGGLRCTTCGGGLEPSGAGLSCRSCGRLFSAFTGVVDFIGLASASDVDAGPAVALTEPVMAALNLPPDVTPLVEEILGRTARTTSSVAEFDAEIRDVADRFGFPVAPVVRPPVVVSVPEPLGLVVERHYVPQTMSTGDRLHCNVRFRNAGDEAVSSSSDPAVMVGFRWYDQHGTMADVPESRTRLPIVMPPGRAVTLPVDIFVPDQPGLYELLICPVIELQRWADECGIRVPVHVAADVNNPATVLDLQPDTATLDYAADHEVALAMLGEWAAPLLSTPGRRVLEIGGATAPQISWFGPHEAVNVDVNLPLLELGALWYTYNATEAVAQNLAFLCADANHLPVADHTFDIVAMFATLHHFAAPELLLAECRRVVKPGGVVAVMCEPVASTLESELTLRDLEKGINEQVFSVEEYLRIFAAAGLTPVGGNQIGGSLRAFLAPGDPSGERFEHVADPEVARPRRRRPLWRRR